MLIALPGRTSTGFTLVELMITIVVLAILVGLGMPSFVQLLRNAEIRNAHAPVRTVRQTLVSA